MTSWARLGRMAVVLGVAACSRPPEAPTELEELTAFLYAHVGTSDPDGLSVALGNLSAWLASHGDALAEGYTVDTLSQASLDALEGGRERDAGALLGAAVSTRAAHTVDEVARAILLVEQTELYGDAYPLWERTFRGDPDCFVEHRCPELLFDNHTVAKLPLGLELESWNTAQYRWSALDLLPALVSRSWLKEPASDNLDLFRMQDQHYLSVTLPTDTGIVRVQAVWADAELVGLEVPEATVLNMLVNGLLDQDATLYEWLDSP